VRKLVDEARRNGILGREEAASLADIPNVRQQGTRLGNWLTKEQAKELLTVPDRSTLKGKRDYVILALLVGCALRRQELASLNIDEIQMREGRWVIADLRGKGGRVRTVAVPLWVKYGVNAWLTAAAGGPLGPGRSGGEGKTGPHGCGSALGQAGYQRLDGRGRDRRGAAAAVHWKRRQADRERFERLGRLGCGATVCSGDRDRALRRPRPPPHLRQTLPQGRR